MSRYCRIEVPLQRRVEKDGQQRCSLEVKHLDDFAWKESSSNPDTADADLLVWGADVQRKLVLSAKERGSLPHDLLNGYNNRMSDNGDVVQLPDNPIQTLDSLLRWIVSTDAREHVKSSEICAGRGLLIELMQLTICINPRDYYQQVPLAFIAIRFGGTVYLARYNTEDMRKRERKAMTNGGLVNRHIGSSFKKFMSTASKDGEGVASGWRQVFAAKLNRLPVLYAAEIDAVDETDNSPVEMSISWSLRHYQTSRFGLQKLYHRAMLSGSKRIFVGEKTQKRQFTIVIDSTLTDVVEYNVNEDIEQVLAQSNSWLGKELVVNKTTELLTRILNVATEDDPYTAYVFEAIPEDGWLQYKIHRNDPNFAFLPHWYIKWIQPEFNRAPLRPEDTETTPNRG